MRLDSRKCISSIVALAIVMTALATSGCASFKHWQQLPTSKADETTIYVVSHGWHTGIVVSQQNLGTQLQFIREELGDSQFYEFGWGEKNFYQAPDNTVWLALRALLWKNESTVHVAAVPRLPADYFPESTTVELHLSSDAHQNLSTAIAAAFAKDANGASKSTREGLYGRSRFFDGNGSYYLTHTCNTWTSDTLAKAGVPMTNLTLTASGVVRQSKWAAKKYQCCAENQ